MGTLKHGVFSNAIHPLSLLQKFAKKKNPRGTLRKLIKPFREACRTAHHVYMGAVRARARARARAKYAEFLFYKKLNSRSRWDSKSQ